ncbi:MAG: universal stress protein [Gammaproteobacteria bacterium]|nr:universal stress protein [Gammaproteobacteria bacterium]
MYRQILVPIDGSATSNAGLTEAIKIAKALGGKIRIVHIVNEMIVDYAFGSGLYANTVIDSMRADGQKILSEAEARVRGEGLEPEGVLIESIGGGAANFVIEQAKEWPADLIVMGTHGRRGVRRLALGSDAELVVRGVTAPVLLVHDRGGKG